MSETKQKHDSLEISYDNLLEYVSQEHTQDHDDGCTLDPPETCATCKWIQDAEYHVKTVKMLLEVCKNLCNIAEVVGYCTGTWTSEHQVLAQQYAEEGRDAIAKATGE